MLLRVFEDSLGTKLKSSDENALNMTGNLPDYIEKINKIQEQYLRSSETDK